MKKFTIAVVFCASLLNILAHDSREQDGIKPEDCDNPQGSGLMSLAIDVKLGLYLPSNPTKKKSALLDPKNNISALFDGENGAAFFFCFETGEVVYLPPGASDKTWNAKDETFKEFTKNMPSSKDFFLLGQKLGSQFDPQTSSEEIGEQITAILGSLSLDYSDKCAALAVALQIAKISSDKLKTSLQGFEQVMGPVDASCRGDLKWLVGCFQGFGNFFENFPGGISALKTKRIRLSLNKMLTAPTGIDTLIYLLKQLAPHYPSLGKILEKVLNPVYSFFVLINNLSGHINYGFDGFIGVLQSILQCIQEKNSEQNLLVELRGFFENPRTENGDLGQKWTTSIRSLQQVVIKIKLQDCEEFKKRLDDILKKKWVEKGVNMTEITDDILQGGPNASENIVEKLKKYLETNAS